LLNYGWPKELSGSLKSITASYLTGLLIGKKIIKEKLETPILDVGMMRL
jgi:ribosomal protein L18